MRIRIIEIIRYASEVTRVEQDKIIGQSRKAFYVNIRNAIALVAHEQGWSYPAIGRVIGGRHHTTILHGVRRAAAMMKGDREFAELVKILRKTKSEFAAQDGTAPVYFMPVKKRILTPVAVPVYTDLAAIHLKPVKDEEENLGRDTDAMRRKIGTDRLLQALRSA
jgi:hypothetical protein